jgi:superfamily II DNA/RNA helicase
MKQILDECKPDGQRLLFSATLDKDVDRLVRTYLKNPIEHSVDTGKASVSTMDHHVLVVHPEDRDAVIAQIASREGRTIIFTRTKHGADKLEAKLIAQGVPTGVLHGGKTQAVRTRTLNDFKDGRINALVATNVAARGIHVDGISLVVHFDAPTDPKDYLHRAGRTARAGESGTVVTMTGPRQQRTVKHMTDRCGVSPTVTRIRPLSKELISITGAKEPSGTPWVQQHARTKPNRTGAHRTSRQRAGGHRTGEQRNGEKRHGDKRGAGQRSGGQRSGSHPSKRGSGAGAPGKRKRVHASR